MAFPFSAPHDPIFVRASGVGAKTTAGGATPPREPHGTAEVTRPLSRQRNPCPPAQSSRHLPSKYRCCNRIGWRYMWGSVDTARHLGAPCQVVAHVMCSTTFDHRKTPNPHTCRTGNYTAVVVCCGCSGACCGGSGRRVTTKEGRGGEGSGGGDYLKNVTTLT